MTVLPNLAAENEALKAQVAAMQAKLANRSKITPKVSENTRCICIYGVGRRPISLYLSQFNAVAAAMPELMAWVKSNPKNSKGETLAVREAD